MTCRATAPTRSETPSLRHSPRALVRLEKGEPLCPESAGLAFPLRGGAKRSCRTTATTGTTAHLATRLSTDCYEG